MRRAGQPLIAVRRRVLNASSRLKRLYRESGWRNTILAAKSPKPALRFPPNCKRFVVFLITGWDFVNGGIMSICSIAAETRKLLAEHQVSVAVCTACGQPRLLRLTKFDNDVELFAFSDLLKWFPTRSEILIHVPDLRVQEFVGDHLDAFQSRTDLKWRFNILLQNIDRIPSEHEISILKALGPTTATINHEASLVLAQKLGCPIHFLSWFISAEDFERIEYARKKKLVVISPDPHPAKPQIIAGIRGGLPDHNIAEVRNMTYRQYKTLIRDAKFMFTFGEGLDGYFVESIFSGAVAMALFQERYFTPQYRRLDGVFENGEHAISEVASFLKATDNEMNFRATSARQYKLVAKTFRREDYQRNINDFYRKFFPAWLSGKRLAV